MKRKADQNLEDSDNQAAKDERKRKRRKYDPEYIAFSFTAIGTNADEPLCIVCLKTLSNDAMKPAKLRRHLTTMHSELASKPKEYFERQKELYLKQKCKLMACTTVNEKALRAFGSITNCAFQKNSHNCRRANSTNSSRYVQSCSRKGIQSKTESHSTV